MRSFDLNTVQFIISGPPLKNKEDVTSLGSDSCDIYSLQ